MSSNRERNRERVTESWKVGKKETIETTAQSVAVAQWLVHLYNETVDEVQSLTEAGFFLSTSMALGKTRPHKIGTNSRSQFSRNFWEGKLIRKKKENWSPGLKVL